MALIMLMPQSVAFAGTTGSTAVAINATNFPDDAFREFVKRYDLDGNGSLSSDEIAKVDTITIDSSYEKHNEIKDLTGIKYFASLRNLNIGYSQITSLDLAGMSNLEMINVYNSNCETVNLSGCTGLEILFIEHGSLTKINLSDCTALTYAYLNDNQLSEVSIGNNPSLTDLELSRNKLTKIDLKNATNLVLLDMSNNELTSLDISKQSKLEYLYLFGNNITSLDIRNHGKLKVCSAADTNISELDCNGCSNLYRVQVNCTVNIKNYEAQADLYHTYSMDKWVRNGNEATQDCSECGGAERNVRRIYGNNRYETSFKIAETLRSYLKVDKFDTVVLATGEGFADALSGSYLAYTKDAPLLLTTSTETKVTETTLKYLKTYLEPGGTVYILGGTAVVPASFDTILAKNGCKVKRLAGADRYETNIKVLEELDYTGPLCVCSGSDYADCLSASSTREPILLAPGKLRDYQIEYLEDHAETDWYTVLGGETVVSPEVRQQLRKISSIYSLYGSNRIETALELMFYQFLNRTSCFLVYSENYPDGLSVGPLASQYNTPILLVNSSNRCVSTVVKRLYETQSKIEMVFVIGGSTLISDDAALKIATVERLQ